LPVRLPGQKVGGIDGEYILNPNHDELDLSDIDLFVAGSEDAIIMVEGSAKEASEEEILQAILFGHQSLKPVIHLQRELRSMAGVKERVFDLQKPDLAIYER